MVANRVSGSWRERPGRSVFTPNSDTPYGGLVLDLSAGPMVVELPPGPSWAPSTDLNQRWVIDMGLPGPDGGQGGKHVLRARVQRGGPGRCLSGTSHDEPNVGLSARAAAWGDVRPAIAGSKRPRCIPSTPRLSGGGRAGST